MLKRRKSLTVFASTLAVLATPVFAWEETPAGGHGSAPSAATGPASRDLGMRDLDAGKAGGTEIRIPGVGTIGVLPKFDLGLQLLYGGNDTEPRPDEKSQPSDVQVRGSLKYRF